MYTAEDYKEAEQRLMKLWRNTFIVIAVALFLALLSSSPTFLVFAFVAFLYAWRVYLQPAISEKEHIKRMVYGARYQVTGVFMGFADGTWERNDVLCHKVLIAVEDKKGNISDKVFYFDIQQEWPDILVGRRITIEHDDGFIANFRLEN